MSPRASAMASSADTMARPMRSTRAFMGDRVADLRVFGKLAVVEPDGAPYTSASAGMLPMMSAIALLLACQLAGEGLTRLFGWPVPGPVLGLVFLFVLLTLRDRLQPHAAPVEASPLGAACGFLLANLSLMFVPAGVGILQEWATLQRDGMAMIAALVVSTALALIVTGFVFQKLAARFAPERDA